MLYADEYEGALWEIQSEVKYSGLLVARLVYAQINGGYIVEAGGWGDRNNLEVIVAGLQNLTAVLPDAAVHHYMDARDRPQVNWQLHYRKRYGTSGESPPSDSLGDFPF